MSDKKVRLRLASAGHSGATDHFKQWRARSFVLAAVLVAVSLLAFAFVRVTGAETYNVTAEAEGGAKGGGLEIISDTTASGGSAVSFKAPVANGSCTINTQPPLQDQLDAGNTRNVWPHTKPNKAVVYFETGELSPPWSDYVIEGAKSWSASACIDARAVASCPAGEHNCVPIVYDTTSNPGSTLGVTHSEYSEGVFTSVDITLYDQSLGDLTPERQQSTTTHEMGHALGLKHRATRLVLLFNTNETGRSTVPDETDFANLLANYGAASATVRSVDAPVTKETIID